MVPPAQGRDKFCPWLWWPEKAQESPAATGLIRIFPHLENWDQFVLLFPRGRTRGNGSIRCGISALSKFITSFLLFFPSLFCRESLQRETQLAWFLMKNIKQEFRLPKAIKAPILCSYSIRDTALAHCTSCCRGSPWPGTKLLHLSVGCLKPMKCSL